MTSPQHEPLVICDASPLILLAKIGHADLLFRLAEEIWIPEVVWAEITRKSGSQPEIPMLMKLFSQCVRPVDAALQSAFQTQVDAGEAAALALAARHPEALLLMDDFRGRMLAQHQGFRCMGTLGLLLRAKRRNLIERMKPLLVSLKQHGMFVSRDLETKTLLAAGETP